MSDIDMNEQFFVCLFVLSTCCCRVHVGGVIVIMRYIMFDFLKL